MPKDASREELEDLRTLFGSDVRMFVFEVMDAMCNSLVVSKC